MANIALISCVSQKRGYSAKAEDMYTSALFTKSMNYVKSLLRPGTTFILSAKYGLLPLEQEIEPYNLTLNGMNSQERKKWADMVLEQLKEACDINNDTFIFLAGRNYYENLIALLPKHEIKMEGLPIGKRLEWLNAQLLRGGNDF